MDPVIPSAYYTTLARIESNNQPYIKASTSSASGLFQFIKSTWVSLGGAWGSDNSKAFGGLRPSEAEQRRMAERLTMQNARTLQAAGIPINQSSLYAAHFLGAGAARTVLRADPSTPITNVTTAAQRAANPGVFRDIRTVGDFWAWLQRKTGEAVGAVTGQGAAMFPCPHCGGIIRADRAP